MDKANIKKLKRINVIFSVLFYIMLLSLAFFAVYRIIPIVKVKPYILFAAIPFIFVNFLIITVFHETGHAFMAKVNGFFLASIDFPFLSYSAFGDKKWRLKLVRGCFGSTNALPLTGRNNRYPLVVFGGILFSFIYFAFCLLALLYGGNVMFALFGFSSPVMFYLWAENVIPSKNGIGLNDGSVLFSFERDPDRTAVISAIVDYQSKLFFEKELSNLKFSSSLPLIREDDPYFAYSVYYCLLSARYTNDQKQIKSLVTRLKSLKCYFSEVDFLPIDAEIYFQSIIDGEGKQPPERLKNFIMTDEAPNIIRIRYFMKKIIDKDELSAEKCLSVLDNRKDKYFSAVITAEKNIIKN